MIKLLLVSLGLTGATVLLHGIGTLYFILRVAKRWNKKNYSFKAISVEILVIRLVLFLLLLHLTEAAIWAVFYNLGGLLETFETAMYFSLASYATLGYGDVVLSGNWRLLGPIEAAVGVLMMGWSTGVIVAVILRTYAQRLNRRGTEPNKH
jgi:hypothetical protein